MKYIEIDNGYAVEGTPAACVKSALFGLFKDVKFDLVLSGINKGINMGQDIFYSGTVAGAREGIINNISGIACSRRWEWEEENTSYNKSAETMVELISDFEQEILNNKILFNINFPSDDEYRGIKVTHLGKRSYDDNIYYSEDKDGKYVSIIGNGLQFTHDEGSDLNSLSEGYISITPLTVTKDQVDLKWQKILKDKFQKNL